MGLNINKGKSSVLLFTHDGIRLKEVGRIRVSNITWHIRHMLKSQIHQEIKKVMVHSVIFSNRLQALA